MNRSTRKPVYEHLPDPVKISIPTECMVVFHGDYVHGGKSYKKSHTCLFMGMHLVNDGNVANITCLQEEEKLPPCDIKGDSTIGDNQGNCSHRKRASKASRNTQKEGYEIGIHLHNAFVSNDFCSNPSLIFIYYITKPLPIVYLSSSILFTSFLLCLLAVACIALVIRCITVRVFRR